MTSGGQAVGAASRRAGVVARTRRVVIDFTASGCGPSRFIAPVFVEFAKKYPHVFFLKVDVDEFKEVAAEYQIEAMATFHFIKNGVKVELIISAKKDELATKVALYAAQTAPSASS
ncbi:hypothetical protein HU200_066862 [Digitaria exilis]|uniref:Thioredoxin domain-containing protein n=1 Tax=Digitaria exilis TaxID=1010633 RepID=A0A834ZXF9_9POAL|nr:hypothetical protein HU200_066862 [Digitaria exilis]